MLMTNNFETRENRLPSTHWSIRHRAVMIEIFKNKIICCHLRVDGLLTPFGTDVAPSPKILYHSSNGLLLFLTRSFPYIHVRA